MPLFKTANFPVPDQASGQWALWQIAETEAELLAQINPAYFAMEELATIQVAQRRQEWLACRLALQSLLPALPVGRLKKNEAGRPYLSAGGWHVSLSHAYPFAAAVVHPLLPVGIDVEKPREQLHRIKHKFLSPAEQVWAGEDVEQLCLLWAAKEALYKLNGQPGLHFARDMHIGPEDESGQLQALLKGNSYALHYSWHNGLLLCVVV